LGDCEVEQGFGNPGGMERLDFLMWSGEGKGNAAKGTKEGIVLPGRGTYRERRANRTPELW